ncbi:MFS transporter [Paenibacillus kandeliae]|uniref:MFS transporter n=1 Tax=Paenibacillus kandeliae TaxID=3231269 RepID=UPI0034592273
MLYADKRSTTSWMMYDWANSAYATTILAAVMPVFYSSVAASTLDKTTAASYLGYTHAIGMLCVALLSPLLGAVSDVAGNKGRFLFVFSLIGIGATIVFSTIGTGDWLLASILLIISTIGFAGSNAFYDALLPDMVPRGQRESVSARGYAYGYIGGGLMLAINLLMIQQPQWFGLPDTLAGTRLSFITVGIWWLVFAIPLFRVSGAWSKRRETAPVMSTAGYLREGMRNIKTSLRGIRRYPELVKLLAAFWFFNDGINTIILMATVYGATIGIGTTDLMLALLMTQFIGFPSTLLFGRLGTVYGAKQLLMVSLSVYLVIVILGYFMTTSWHFYMLAALVGLVQGGSQALARSLFSDLIPPQRTGEYFGLINVTGKFASIFGPFLFGLVGQLTGSARYGILSLLFFFIIGMGLLLFVRVEQGREQALQKMEKN